MAVLNSVNDNTGNVMGVATFREIAVSYSSTRSLQLIVWPPLMPMSLSSPYQPWSVVRSAEPGIILGRV